ncbi:carbohydrate porin [Rubritalea marina]|uniref:carbohydrate porin n=1 Tax=Rubritalea marina TaxID=361055 RepID=UPI00036FC913|nr:carbohydrate porin [Rubritalea marina]
MKPFTIFLLTCTFVYGDSSGFSGPSSVEKQVQADAIEGSHTSQDLLERWKDRKEKVKEQTGFSINSDYSFFYLAGSNDFGPSEAGSGVFRVYGAWDLIDRGGDNPGGLIYKVEHRHRFTDTTPSQYSLAVGNVGFLGAPYNDDKVRLTNLYWKQSLGGGRFKLMLGFLDATDYVDVYGLANPWTAFTNLAFSTGGSSIALPNDATFGAVAGYWINEHMYTIGSVSDLNARPTDPLKSAEYFFTRNEYFKSVELGWTTSQDRVYFDNVHFTLWHVDMIEASNTPEGWGINFSANKWIDDLWMPFLKAGYTEDAGSLLETSVSAGVGYKSTGSNDLLGAAFNWGIPNENTFGAGREDQYTVEVFYRYQLTENIALTPDIQYLINPALNPQDSSILLGGLRARIVF